jgi:DNA-binding NarL/FixJ family response regulator
MTQTSRFANFRATERLAWLPVALPSTLLFRAQGDSPDAIVIAVRDGFLARLGNRSGLGEIFLDTPTILLADEPGTALVRSAARMNIYSVLPLEVATEQLVAAISATVAGFSVTPPRLPTGTADAIPGSEHLTAREVEILRLMARGYRNKQVAAQLNISQHTVKYHVSSVLAKLGARTRTEAVTIGVTRGLVAI